MMRVLFLLVLTLTSGCFNPTINGRRSTSSSVAANAALSFKTFMYQFIPGLGSVADNTNDDRMYGTVMDTNGYTYVCGSTASNMYATASGGGDVYITKFDNSGIQVWAKQWIATTPGIFANPNNYDMCDSLSLGIGNSIYVGGYTMSSLFNTINGPRDVWVAKVNTDDGSIIWGLQFNNNMAGAGNIAAAAANAAGAVMGGGSEYGGQVAADLLNGGVYVYGFSDLAPGVNFAGEPGTGGNGFIFKINSGGSFLWGIPLVTTYSNGKIATDTSAEVTNYIITDSSGNAYFSGYTNAGFATGSGGGSGSNDAFVGKINSAGTVQWLNQLITGGLVNDASLSDSMYALATDNTFLYAMGHSKGNFTAPGSNTAVNNYDPFITKVNMSTGALVWLKELSTTVYGANINNSTGIDRADDGFGGTGGGLGVDGSGNIYFSGITSGSFLGTNTSANMDIYVGKLDNNGGWVWGRQISTATAQFAPYLMSSTGNEYIYGLSVRSDGNLAIGGYSDSNFISTMGVGTPDDMFLIHLDKNGNL